MGINNSRGSSTAARSRPSSNRVLGSGASSRTAERAEGEPGAGEDGAGGGGGGGAGQGGRGWWVPAPVRARRRERKESPERARTWRGRARRTACGRGEYAGAAQNQESVPPGEPFGAPRTG